MFFFNRSNAEVLTIDSLFVEGKLLGEDLVRLAYDKMLLVVGDRIFNDGLLLSLFCSESKNFWLESTVQRLLCEKSASEPIVVLSSDGLVAKPEGSVFESFKFGSSDVTKRLSREIFAAAFIFFLYEHRIYKYYTEEHHNKNMQIIQWLLAYHYGQPHSTLGLSNIDFDLYLDG